MKFYNREKEIALLQEIEKSSENFAQMTMLTGRRRIGKTTLLKYAFHKNPVLYFFVAKKSETLLCEEFSHEIEEKLSESLGSFSSFAELFKKIMQLSQRLNFTLIIDEFQEFKNINKSVFGDMQNYWDSYKETGKINLILCGSIFSLMHEIFENSKEPLFGRMTSKIILKPFSINTIKQILSDFHPQYSSEDLLAFYMVTGGVAKYVEQLVMKSAFSKNAILKTVLQEGSFFINEGKDVLIEDFGKDYANYFSILSLIASSKNERAEIENILKIPVGGFLDKLEHDYNIIKRVKPFMAKEGGRIMKYRIEDNFLTFWFRFIYKYRSAVEIGNFDYIKNIVSRDYETFSDFMLEKYFRTKMMESHQFSDIQNYWNKKGEDEIDIVAVNDFEKTILFCEVKRNRKRININVLENKAKEIVKRFSDYSVKFSGLSLEDM